MSAERSLRRMPVRIITERGATGIVLRVVGGLQRGTIHELREEIERARNVSADVAVDLTAIEAMDRQAVLFFIVGEGRTIEIIDCPSHVRKWIRGEARRHGVRRGGKARGLGIELSRDRFLDQ